MQRLSKQLEFDAASGEIAGPGGRERLEPQTLALLATLSAQPGAVVSRDALLDEVWSGRVVSDVTLSGAVSRLRAALREIGVEDVRITTLSKRGYRLDIASTDVKWIQAGRARRVGTFAVAGLFLLLLPLLVQLAGVPGGESQRLLSVEFSILQPDGRLIEPQLMVESGSIGKVLVGENDPLRLELEVGPQGEGNVRLDFVIASLSDWGRFVVVTPFGEENRFSMRTADGQFDIGVRIRPVEIRSELGVSKK